MAKRRQTKTKKTTRVKKTPEPKVNQILEYKGWSAGDRCHTVFANESKPSLCDIQHFYPDDIIAPSVSLNEVATGKYRVAPVAVISETAKGAKDLRPVLDTLLLKHKKKQLLLQIAVTEQKQKQQLLQKQLLLQKTAAKTKTRQKNKKAGDS